MELVLTFDCDSNRTDVWDVVISWSISVIVEARSQLEHATKDKLRWCLLTGRAKRWRTRFRCVHTVLQIRDEGSNFSKLMSSSALLI